MCIPGKRTRKAEDAMQLNFAGDDQAAHNRLAVNVAGALPTLRLSAGLSAEA